LTLNQIVAVCSLLACFAASINVFHIPAGDQQNASQFLRAYAWAETAIGWRPADG
jgi:hypothetical protein